MRLPSRPAPAVVPLRRLNVELSGRCNLGCDYCPIHHYTEPMDPAFMTQTTFDGLVGAFAGLDILDFSGWGETLLHPKFFGFVDRARRHGARCITLTTNATLLDKERIRRGLLDHPLEALSLSLDAATPDTYARLRRGGNWNRVIDGIGRLAAERRGRRPYLSASFLLMRQNIGEVHEFARLMHGLGVDEVVFKHLAAVFSAGWRDSILFDGYFAERPEGLEEAVASFGEQVERIGRGIPIKVFVPESFSAHADARCRFDAMDHLFIRWDGQAAHCCPLSYPTAMEGPDHRRLFEGVHPLGNVNRTPLADLWVSDRCQTPNRDWHNGSCPSICSDCVGHYDVAGIRPL